jgi:hypothetical protein
MELAAVLLLETGVAAVVAADIAAVVAERHGTRSLAAKRGDEHLAGVRLASIAAKSPQSPATVPGYARSPDGAPFPTS